MFLDTSTLTHIYFKLFKIINTLMIKTLFKIINSHNTEVLKKYDQHENNNNNNNDNNNED